MCRANQYLAGSQAMHEAEMLAQGIEKQQQHHDAAGQPQVVARFGARLEPSPPAHQPGEQNEQTYTGAKKPGACFSPVRFVCARTLT